MQISATQTQKSKLPSFSAVLWLHDHNLNFLSCHYWYQSSDKHKIWQENLFFLQISAIYCQIASQNVFSNNDFSNCCSWILLWVWSHPNPLPNLNICALNFINAESHSMIFQIMWLSISLIASKLNKVTYFSQIAAELTVVVRVFSLSEQFWEFWVS